MRKRSFLAPGRVTLDRKARQRSEEHTSELQSADHLVCRLLLEKKKKKKTKGSEKGKIFGVTIKSNISTNKHNVIVELYGSRPYTASRQITINRLNCSTVNIFHS